MSKIDYFCCPDSLTKYRRKMHGMYGNNQNGALVIIHRKLKIIFSCGDGWEHVSASSKNKVPTYEQMCWLKEQFWPEQACVMQLHVPKNFHINTHPHCLHLWRPINVEIPQPPQVFV